MWWIYLGFLLVFYILARNHLEFWFPLVMLRSKKFTKELYEFGTDNSKILKKFFSIGIFLGFLMMLYSLYYLAEGVVRLPVETGSRLEFLIPGTEVAGLKFPLVQGIIAISLVVAIHEFGHGIASAAEGIRPISTAFVLLFGVIPGGGVELDDKKIKKKTFNSRMRIMCAGSLMNIMLAIIVLLANKPLIELGKGYLAVEGMRIIDLEEGSAAYEVLQEGMIIEEINGVKINSLDSLNILREIIKPDSQTFVGTDHGMFVLLSDVEGKVGFSAIPEYTMTETIESQTIFWISDLFGWTFLASLGLAVANMMPLWPFDGGYVMKEVLDKLRINQLLKPIYSLTLALVLINIFSPWIRGFIGIA